jgi:DNA-binding NarL/FixJ family response regulator
MVTRDGAVPPPPAAEPERRVLAKDGEMAAGVAPPGRILIVEDDYLVASELEATLNDEGFQVVGVTGTADQAIGLARSHRPDLAIVDVRLIGERDGVDAAVTMFSELGIRSIFATADDNPDTRQRAMAASPIGWLAKPYSPTRLILLIRSALPSSR